MLNIVATCWNVVATCWILIQLLLGNNNILARSWNGGRGNVAVPLRFERAGTEKSRTDWSVDWCYQNSIRARTQLIPTLRPPCWYCHETTWHQTRKTIGSTAGSLLNGIEPSSIFVQQRSTTFNMLNGRFQRSTSHDTLSTFVEQRLQHLLLNKCWTVYHWL